MMQRCPFIIVKQYQHCDYKRCPFIIVDLLLLTLNRMRGLILVNIQYFWAFYIHINCLPDLSFPGVLQLATYQDCVHVVGLHNINTVITNEWEKKLISSNVLAEKIPRSTLASRLWSDCLNAVLVVVSIILGRSHERASRQCWWERRWPDRHSPDSTVVQHCHYMESTFSLLII